VVLDPPRSQRPLIPLAMPENRLLLIDDDRVFSLIVRRAGEACGYEVTALTHLKNEGFLQQIDPTVIVLDLIMPGQDGIEVLRMLGASKNQAHVVIVSVADEKSYRRRK
jgi:DNA-binding response OmpR family regulator